MRFDLGGRCKSMALNSARLIFFVCLFFFLFLLITVLLFLS